MPISSQCLQNKNVGEFYNETHKESNNLLMRCNSKHRNRVDNCNDDLSNFKESGVAMDLIFATNNNCPNLRKKSGVDTTKKTLVTLAIFLLSVKQANSLNLNTSTEVSITTFPSPNQKDLGLVNNHHEAIGDYRNKQPYIDSESGMKLRENKNERGIFRAKRIPRGSEANGIDKFKKMIVNRHAELITMDKEDLINEIINIVAQNRQNFRLDNLPNPFSINDLPADFRNAVAQYIMEEDLYVAELIIEGVEDDVFEDVAVAAALK